MIGDAALVETGGKRVPGVAPAAKQQGRYVARVLAARLAGPPRPAAVRLSRRGQPRDDRPAARGDRFPFLTLRGWIAWWIWGFAHIYFLVGVPSPVVVSLRWLWEYLTYGRGARLITGSVHAD